MMSLKFGARYQFIYRPITQLVFTNRFLEGRAGCSPSNVQTLTTMDGGNADIAGAIYLSPCPNHYDGRLATMPSADFCLIT